MVLSIRLALLFHGSVQIERTDHIYHVIEGVGIERRPLNEGAVRPLDESEKCLAVFRRDADSVRDIPLAYLQSSFLAPRFLCF